MSGRYERTPTELAQEVRTMSNPMEWPNLALPVKRINGPGMPECAIMLAGAPKVYLHNLFDEPANLKDAEVLEYESYEAVVADGWVVD